MAPLSAALWTRPWPWQTASKHTACAVQDYCVEAGIWIVFGFLVSARSNQEMVCRETESIATRQHPWLKVCHGSVRYIVNDVVSNRIWNIERPCYVVH